MAQQYPQNFFATLKGNNIIETAVKKEYDSPSSAQVRLYEDGLLIEELTFISKGESKSSFIYTFSFKSKIILGRDYDLYDGKNEFSPVDLTFLTTQPEFEKKYRYDGELGALYTKKATTFRVFSPLATGIVVYLISPKGKEEFYSLNRLPCGVFEAVIKGDYEKYRYAYLARINGNYFAVADPYAYALGLNSRMGYVVDLEKIKAINSYEDKLPEFKSKCESIIYECNVRDMTSLLDEQEKGTYNLLSKTGLKDKNGKPAGLDYIASLGVTHVQLMPIYDFATIRDDKPLSTYNWGYDPLFYLVPEGSYSSDPDDPYKRLIELKKLISAFHKKGIRVNMDVVFNHTFQFVTSALNLLCPNYYYRFNDEGEIANGTGCGNETESRRYMMRKLILDACLHFVKVFGIDGFRFDLMGLIDIDTISKVEKEVRKLKPNAMIYGEGWNMNSPLPHNEKACMNNCNVLPEVGFFNDRFRDILKGNNYGDSLARGYLTGDGNYIDGFKHVFMGSSIAYAFPPLFKRPHQSINYVECHDDMVLFDKIKALYPYDEEKILLSYQNMINIAVALSFGIPFFHAGQEFGQSKKGRHNTYNAGDEFNGINYDLRDCRKEMVEKFKGALAIRKKYPYFKLDDPKKIEELVDFVNLQGKALAIVFKPYKDCDGMVIVVNPTRESVSYQLDDYYRVIFGTNGTISTETFANLFLVPKLSISIAVKDKEKEDND